MKPDKAIDALQRAVTLALWSALAALTIAHPTAAQTPAGKASQAAAAPRDGQHDFDFNLGTWKAEVKRLKNPLTGSRSWIDLKGTVTVSKVWDGRAQMSSYCFDNLIIESQAIFEVRSKMSPVSAPCIEKPIE